MPYIDQEARERLASPPLTESAGELNYMLTLVVKDYIERKGTKYETYNTVLGVLSAMQMELYRRLIAPYEDRKRKENGDVF